MPETHRNRCIAGAGNLLMTLLTPLTWLFSQWKKLLGRFVHSSESDAITEGELITMVSEAENDGELTDRESQLIRSAIEFDDVEVEEILTPRVDVIAVEDDLSLEELAQIFAESAIRPARLSRHCWTTSSWRVHEKDFYIARLEKVRHRWSPSSPHLYHHRLHLDLPVAAHQEQHHHMAVVDEYGTEGIIAPRGHSEELVWRHLGRTRRGYGGLPPAVGRQLASVSVFGQRGRPSRDAGPARG